MALDLKPLTQDVIQSMGFTSHDLWEVKIEGEVFGPFEVISLRDYASENEKQFYHALATRMDSNDWQPFFSVPELKKVSSHTSGEAEDRYWVLEQGQKIGPISSTAIEKKIEMNILSLTDEVSTDDGHTWVKLYQVPLFNPVVAGGVDSLPHTPQEASFQNAKKKLKEVMKNSDRSGQNAELAGLVFMGKKEATVSLNLDEMDLKSLSQTQVSRSLRWAIPAAIAGLAAIGTLGYYLITPSVPTEMDVVAQAEEGQETTVKKKSRVSMPAPEPVKEQKRPAQVVKRTAPAPRPVYVEPAYQEPPQPVRQPRMPANYPAPERRQTATIHDNAYPNPEVETHLREPDPMNEQIVEGDNYPLPHEMEDPSAVGRPIQPRGANPPSIIRGRRPARDRYDREAQDPAMGTYPEGDYPPDGPMVEEATDF